MRKIVTVAAVALMLIGLAAPALAADEKAGVELSGWIADEKCGANNANAEGAACTKACAKNGAALVLVSGDKIYKLSDQKLAMSHIGYEVVVVGTLKADTVQVTAIKKKSDDEA